MRGRFGKRFFIIIAIVGDLIAVNIGVLLALWLGSGCNLLAEDLQLYMKVSLFISLYTVLIFTVLGLYIYKERTKVAFLYNLSLGVVAIFFMSIALVHSLGGKNIPLIAPLLQLLFVFTWRIALRRLLSALLKVKHIILIAHNDDIPRLVGKFLTYSFFKIELVKTYNENEITALMGNRSIFQDIDGLCIDSRIETELRRRLVKRAIDEDIELYLVPDFYDVFSQNVSYDKAEDLPLFYMRRFRLSLFSRWLKRGFDIVVSLLCLILGIPLFLFIILMVRLSSSGPIFYIQERIGLNGRSFNLIKFRTMIDGAEDETGPVVAQKDDSRITRVGKGLRAVRLDELPQIINVLKGEMSLVGPRPERPIFVERFIKEIPGYEYRFRVRPGLTGLAQVEGDYNTNIKDKLIYDLLYIQNYSFLLDIEIILKTFSVPFFPEKAEGRNNKRAEGVVEVASTHDKGL